MCLMRIFSFFEETSMILITLLSHVAVLEQYTAHVAIREQSLNENSYQTKLILPTGPALANAGPNAQRKRGGPLSSGVMTSLCSASQTWYNLVMQMFQQKNYRDINNTACCCDGHQTVYRYTSTIRNQVENCTMEIRAESASAKLRQSN